MDTIDIRDIVGKRRVDTYFQPIVSARNRMTIGVEALSRTYGSRGDVISYPAIAQEAVRRDLSVEFDRLCRERAVENFTAIPVKTSELLLFINLDTSIIDKGVVGSGHFLNVVKKYNINPENVVIEILEAKATDMNGLKAFTQMYKELGFLLAIDDMGIGNSNIDRIMYVRPDIIKLDRGLVSCVDTDYYKQEAFKSMVGLARRIGALVVAEGVETEAEALTSLELGADMLQGYYFMEPQRMQQDTLKTFTIKIDAIADNYKKSRIEAIKYEQSALKFYTKIMDTLIVELTRVSPAGFTAKLMKFVKLFPALEYLYILDMEGRQITDSICCEDKNMPNTCKIFQAALAGADQSLKDYYLHIQAGAERYTSRPYMSLASGRLCITASMVFQDIKNNKFILCADFNP